jgi:hypothetical protein
MEKVVAVITCDIIQSQKYSNEQRKKIDTLLRREFTTVSKVYKDTIHTPASFKVTGGDEFQFVLAKVEKSYEFLVFYRSLIALVDLTPMLSFRSSIGVGEIAVENKKDSYSEDGKAFHHSRLGINLFRNHKSKGKRRTQIITGDAGVDDTLNMVLTYQDMLEGRWTRPQWEAIRWRMILPTYEEIGKRLEIAYQNVQKRVKAANWDEFSQGLEFIERSLKAHLQKGVTGSFTPKGV